MPGIKRLLIVVKTLHQLGVKSCGYYAIYWLGLHTGHYRRCTPAGESNIDDQVVQEIIANRLKHPLLPRPAPNVLHGLVASESQSIREEAEEIVEGKIRLYGGAPVPIRLAPLTPLSHWTAVSDSGTLNGDIKDTWEPARFGWAFTLGRAYLLCGDERYSKAFWNYFEIFYKENPVNLGPNWASAQEVGLRIIALAFAWEVFSGSAHTTPQRQRLLVRSIIKHAARIPPTMIYAHAQNNNHLLSEAAGLFTAGLFLEHYPRAEKWRKQGWKIFCQALSAQIDPDGSYIQHSVNYHRLMLHLALWVFALARREDLNIPEHPISLLQAASCWLIGQLDPLSGQTPNLGNNDGSNILPLVDGGTGDYRPVAQAAARAFLGAPCLPPGAWDELSYWLGLPTDGEQTRMPDCPEPSLRLGSETSWASMRAARFHSRPGQADQLHVDLWWNGHNIALDAGTYRYNAPPPWDNRLAGTAVHNSILVNHSDQMTRAGRFLWLDWAQATIIQADHQMIIAEHNGYRRLGITHRRTLTHPDPSQWLIEDDLLPDKSNSNQKEFTLHWLLPDWKWSIEKNTLKLIAPFGQILLDISSPSPNAAIQIVRGGEVIYGTQAEMAVMGWFAPTYGHKIPALSLLFSTHAKPPLKILSRWTMIGVK